MKLIWLCLLPHFPTFPPILPLTYSLPSLWTFLTLLTIYTKHSPTPGLLHWVSFVEDDHFCPHRHFVWFPLSFYWDHSRYRLSLNTLTYHFLLGFYIVICNMAPHPKIQAAWEQEIVHFDNHNAKPSLALKSFSISVY